MAESPEERDERLAKKLTDNLKQLGRDVEQAEQDAARKALLDPARGLPFEYPETAGSDPTVPKSGPMSAIVPLPNKNRAKVDYDPQKPDFGFSVVDPNGEPLSIPGIPGMDNGETKASLKPMQVPDAINKAGGIELRASGDFQSRLTAELKNKLQRI